MLAVGSVGVLGGVSVSGPAAAKTARPSSGDGGNSGGELQWVTNDSQYCNVNRSWLGPKEHYKGELGQSVALVNVDDDPFGSGKMYYVRTAATASRGFYEREFDTVFGKDPKYSPAEFCSNAPVNMGFENLESFSGNVGLQIPDGGVGVGGSPHQLISSTTEKKWSNVVFQAFKAAVGSASILGKALTVHSIVDAFGVSDTKDIGDNEHQFKWEFDDWYDAPDGFDHRSSNCFVEFGIRTPPDVSPRFTIRTTASGVGQGHLKAENTFKASNGRLTQV